MSQEIEDEVIDELDAKPSERPLKALIDPAKLASDLKFTEATLKDAFIDQAGMFAFYASREAQAGYQADKRKQAMEIVEARLDHKIRKEASESGTKITEGKIAQTIRLDPSYQEAADKYNQAKMIYNLAKGATESFKQRRDMLIQCGADAREELKGSLRMSATSDVKDRAAEFAKKQSGRS